MMTKPTSQIPQSAQSPALVRVSSAFLDAQDQPRFELQVPEPYLRDAGVGYLVRHEKDFGGYEYATRAFLDAHLSEEVTFIDVGAHWGTFALHAASAPNGVHHVIAIEADPTNFQHMSHQMTCNGLQDRVELVSCAAGAEDGEAPLVINSTMGNSLHGLGLPEKARRDQSVTVKVRSLDAIFEASSAPKNGPVIIKIDVEGFEPEVLLGMHDLLEGGRVQAIVWEQGVAFTAADRAEALQNMLSDLDRRGFSHFRFAHPSMGGPLLPYTPVPESLNVFSLAADVRPRMAYGDRKRKLKEGRIPPLSSSCRAAQAGPPRAAVTKDMLAAQTTDATRWVDPAELSPHADERAAWLAEVIPFDIRLVDVGCGLQRLRKHIRGRGVYTPVDLVQWTPDTLTCDLNAKAPLRGTWDYAALSHVLEYLHDPSWVLELLAERAHVLTVLLAPETENPEYLGWFWTEGVDGLTKMLPQTGWTLKQVDTGPLGTRVVAQRLSLI